MNQEKLAERIKLHSLLTPEEVGAIRAYKLAKTSAAQVYEAMGQAPNPKKNITMGSWGGTKAEYAFEEARKKSAAAIAGGKWQEGAEIMREAEIKFNTTTHVIASARAAVKQAGWDILPHARTIKEKLDAALVTLADEVAAEARVAVLPVLLAAGIPEARADGVGESLKKQILAHIGTPPNWDQIGQLSDACEAAMATLGCFKDQVEKLALEEKPTETPAKKPGK